MAGVCDGKLKYTATFLFAMSSFDLISVGRIFSPKTFVGVFIVRHGTRSRQFAGAVVVAEVASGTVGCAVGLFAALGQYLMISPEISSNFA